MGGWFLAIKAPRGTHDILPSEMEKWHYIEEITRKVASDYGYREIKTPIFEHTELFSRGIGDTTDIVEKEMYTFKDKGGRSITLRPEGTASIVRAVGEHGLYGKGKLQKLFMIGPMFRYERPQSGRYRQFWQLDFEAIGSSNPYLDVEVISLSVEIFSRLGLKGLSVELNSVGCPKCRPNYREVLKDYLRPHFEELCESCQSRFDRNVLRILDCKNEGCKRITEDAPYMVDYLCEECAWHFEEVRKGLGSLGIPYRINHRLVRGLDYYTKTAYEVISGELGAQNAVCGGGRYDELSEDIGGPPIPGVGFAAGVERIVLTMEQQGVAFPEGRRMEYFVVVLDSKYMGFAARVVHTLRSKGMYADMDYFGRSLKAQMRYANSLRVKKVVFVGQEEVESGKAKVKDMETGEQIEVEWGDLGNE